MAYLQRKKPMIKVALAGAHRVGKTTLLKLVETNPFYDVEVTEMNTSNTYKRLGLNVKAPQTIFNELRVQMECLTLMQSKSIYRPELVQPRKPRVPFKMTDRSPLDYAAYTLYKFKDLPGYSKVVEEFVETCIELANNLDHIIILQPAIPGSESDTSAPFNEPQIQEITNIIIGLSVHPKLTAKVSILPEEVVKPYERVQYVLDIFEQAQKEYHAQYTVTWDNSNSNMFGVALDENGSIKGLGPLSK